MTVEKIHYVLWCPVIQYSNPGVLVSCCVVLTERRIFILQLKNKDSTVEGVPEMETFYILPLCNIQQVLTGLCYSYIRVEESFVGASGTFALLTPDSENGKDFFECLNSMCEGDTENNSLDVVNCCQSSDLSKQIYDYEETLEECTGRVAFAAHVHVAESRAFVYLVLTENRAYIVKSSVIFWPKPTFDVNQIETEPKFEIAQQFSVEGKISDLQTYIVHELALSHNGKLPPVTPTGNVRYAEFGLSMTFHELLGSHKFDFHFFTTKARDSFLERLTNLRSEYVHRMSPTVREAPEGGNESSDGSDDNHKTSNQSDVTDTNRDDSKAESDAENQSQDEAHEEGDKLEQLKDVSGQRKLRSKTEIIITKSSQSMTLNCLVTPGTI